MRLNANAKDILILFLASIVPTILLWVPFFLNIPSIWGIDIPDRGMATVIANYDGPYYIVTAKSLYKPEEIEKFQFSLPNEYYAAHFPGFPLLIRAAAPIFGYPWAMMAITVISSVFALSFFYLLLKETKLAKYALWITIVFSILPARWLVVRSIGSPEPLFIGAVLAAFYFFTRAKKNDSFKFFILAGLFGALAQLTKSPGILLFTSLALALVTPKLKDLLISPLRTIPGIILKILPLFLIPLAAISIFFFYSTTYKDFFAYFHSGDNIHLLFPPFQVFNTHAAWVGTFWLEEVIWLYLFGLLSIFYLIKQKYYDFAWFVGIFFASTIFVSHRDIARYILPIVPFIFIAFGEVLTSKSFRWALAFLVLPIYLYSLNFIIGNVTPVADWGPLL